MKLSDLARAIPGAAALQAPETEVTEVTHDSRRVRPGALFVAVPGRNADGARFAADAIARGAVAIAAEAPLALPAHIGFLLVPAARPAVGELASAVLGHPSERLRLVGVTGTDGKTTTTRLIAAVLAASGRRTGWFTTIDLGLGDQVLPNPIGRTTPEGSDLQVVLSQMAEAGVEDVVLEVSSHALALDRLAGCRFDAAVFTNLASEHLDFHGTLEAYAAAKARLFEMLGAPTHKRWSRMGVVNADDPASVTMAAASPAAIVSYGLETAADVTAAKLQLRPDATRFTLVTPIAEIEVTTRLVGRHNVANWLAAAAVALGWGIDLDAVALAAEKLTSVPGRLQWIVRGQPFRVAVDFAHTPQALAATLRTLKSFTSGQLYLVFGMAGGRDPRNRPTMGSIAMRETDFFIISTDDPLHEDPARIAREVAAGAEHAGAQEGVHYLIELDRRQAVRLALRRARPGDTVLLAGKGHERTLAFADRSEPWSDTEVAAEVLAELGYQA